MGSLEPAGELPPHVLIFPFPAQGHVNSMLELAKLLCLSQIHVTLLLSHYTAGRLRQFGNIETCLSRFPGIQIATISDGLPDNHPRSGLRTMDLVLSIKRVGGSEFRKLMESSDALSEEGARRRVSCLIMDGGMGFCVPVVQEMGISFLCFRAVSSVYYWSMFCMDKIIEAGELPLIGEDEDTRSYWKKQELDSLVKSVPGMEGFLRKRDIPRLGKIGNVNDPVLQSIITETQLTTLSSGLILNTFEELDKPVLDQIREHVLNVYSLGPLHTHSKCQLESIGSESTQISSSFWKEDHDCLTWLDSHEPDSVIYVSFGSLTILTRTELLEIWYGLVNSGHKFLWVMRPDCLVDGSGENKVPLDLDEATKERGYIVEWVPQHEVLAHPAVGAFYTHSGWNSTLESISIGKPMICWPYFADQMINSRFVSDVWKLGLDMKDTCDRVIVERSIQDVMDVRRDEFLERARKMAILAKEAVSIGGSSCSNLSRLIEFIKSL